MPSDHHIEDEAAFRAAVATAAPLARDGWLVTFGITPDRAETGYGYIQRGEALAEGAWRAARFAEKPDRATAEGYLARRRLGLERRDLPVRADACSTRAAPPRPGGARRGRKRFGIPAHCLDRHGGDGESGAGGRRPGDMGWSDIGSWEALHALGPVDGDGNLLTGDVVAPDSRNCLVRSDGPVVVALGVEDLVIVATERAVLVIPRGETQRVREAIEALEARPGRRHDKEDGR